MRLALLADIHGNLEALNACLDHAKSQGAQRFAFLGDFLGYGAEPSAVLDIVEAYAADGAIVVLGNHDVAVLDHPSVSMNEYARIAIEWTKTRLLPHHFTFLASLPLIHNEHDMTFVHASADAPDMWIYVTDPLRAAYSLDATRSAYLFCGHVHEQVLYYTGASGRPLHFAPVPGTPIPVAHHRRWLAIAGSVGQPRDGNPAAAYALFDTEQATLTYYRLAYDYELAASKVRAAGLPERLALRLEHGD